MLHTKIFNAIAFLIISQDCAFCCQNEFNLADKVYLKAEELVNLVAKENKNRIPKDGIISRMLRQKITVSTLASSDLEDYIATDYTNEGLLKRHKVWSRWGKWSDCSVTCGDGIMARRRVCVAGRCAPGEIEEQHRPCSRSSCNASNVTETLDLE